MENHIGIVLPPDLKEEIISFGQRHGCVITEPHIMLIPDEMLKGVKALTRNLESFCLSQPTLKTAVGGPNIEIRDSLRIFRLVIMMGPINATRNLLIKRLRLPAEGKMFKPSVALARQEADGPYDFDAMLAEAKTLFSKPRSIDVDALAIYSRDSDEEPFHVSALYPFTGR